jgi:hypothetical protein
MGLGLAVTLHAYGASRATAWALLPPFFVGAYGMLSALTGTCSFTALAGRRRAEARTEPVADRAELAAIRRRGGGLVALSFAVAAVAAALMALAE